MIISVDSAKSAAKGFYHLTTDLLAMPFGFSSTADYFLHPQIDAGCQTHAQGHKADERTTEYPADYNGCKEYTCAQHVGASLEGFEHGLIADRGRRME